MATVGRSTVAASCCSIGIVSAHEFPSVAVDPVGVLIGLVPVPPAAFGLAIAAGFHPPLSPAAIFVPGIVAIVLVFFTSLAPIPIGEFVTGHPEFFQVPVIPVNVAAVSLLL